MPETITRNSSESDMSDRYFFVSSGDSVCPRKILPAATNPSAPLIYNNLRNPQAIHPTTHWITP